MIRLTRLEVENFEGVRDVTLDLRAWSGLVFVTGPNGAGKTSLFADAPFWALFGETTKDGPADGVVREGARGGCRVTVDVTIPGVAHALRVTRYRKHPQYRNAVHVLQDGQLMAFDLAAKAQAYLTRVLGCDATTFRHRHVFSQRTLARFSMATAGEQTKMLERALGLTVLPLAREAASRRLAEVAQRLAEAQARVTVHAEALREAQTEAAGLNGVSRRQALARLRAARAARSTAVARLSVERAEHQRVLGRFQAMERRLAEAEAAGAQARARLRDLGTQLVRLRAQGICPTCRQVVTAGTLLRSFEQERRSLEEMARQADARLNSERRERARIQSTLAEMDGIVATWDRMAQRWQQREMAAAEALRVASVQREQVHARIRTLQRRVADVQGEVTRLARRCAHYRFWVRGYGPSGVRADALAAVVPRFTGLVNAWLRRWQTGLVARIGWSETGRLQFEVNGRPFAMCSGGEAQDVDLAVMLALAHVGPIANIAWRVMDDPWHGIAQAGRRRLAEEWRRESQGGPLTLVLVPDQDEIVDEFADRVVRVAPGGRIA